jgi:hypothetical protein
MSGKKFSNEKVKEILKELGKRKKIVNAKVQFAADGKMTRSDNVIGNVDSCTDVVCGGGAGNVAACDDVVCQDPDADPGTIGNTSACGDWAC